MRSSTASLRLRVESALAGRVPAPFRLRDNAPPVVVPTGIPALDEFAGGLPRGSLTEIYGPPYSGKTSILHSALATRTSASEACALVDAQDSFDPATSKLSGVFLPKLLWVRSHGLVQAFRCLDLLLQGGGFGFVVLDLADAPVRLVRKVPLNVWFRLRRAVENTPTILLVLSLESNAKTCASLVLRVEREAVQWSASTDKTAPVPHTPGSSLKGAVHAAEVVRSLLHYQRPHPIDQPGSRESRVRFPLHSDPYTAPAHSGGSLACPDTGRDSSDPATGNSSTNTFLNTPLFEGSEREQEERRQNPD